MAEVPKGHTKFSLDWQIWPSHTLYILLDVEEQKYNIKKRKKRKETGLYQCRPHKEWKLDCISMDHIKKGNWTLSV